MNRARICVYPGSFDPPTVGHMDMIRRAAAMYDKVIVAVIRNPHKPGCFAMEERMRMLQICCAGLDNVVVDSFVGLTLDYVHAVGAGCMLRGLRSSADFDSEQQLAQINQHIDPGVETVFFMCRPEHRSVSSSGVREMAQYGCNLHGFVPEEILGVVARHFQMQES